MPMIFIQLLHTSTIIPVFNLEDDLLDDLTLVSMTSSLIRFTSSYVQTELYIHGINSHQS